MKKPPPATFLWRIEIRVPEAALRDFEAVLEPCCASISSFMLDDNGKGGDNDKSDWRIEGFTGAEPDKEALARAFTKTAKACGFEAPKAKIQLVPPTDWLAENMADFPPLRIGRYFIHGSRDKGAPPPGSVAITLDAGAAFGSGEHPSTAGCLMALDRLAKGRHFRRPLDMGCGSGILTLAMTGTWKAPVVACDIDPEAVRVTAHNVKNNGRITGGAHLVRAVHGPGYQTPAVRNGGPYDLICANILARPLCDMAGDATGFLDRPGVVILSGLVERDAMRVIARHRAHGLRLIRTIILSGWITIVMGRQDSR